MERLFEKATTLLAWFQTGSSVICSPPVLDTDRDYVLLGSEGPKRLEDDLIRLGYIKTTKEYGNKDIKDPFAMYNKITTFRFDDPLKGPDNLIVVHSTADYMKWKVATKVATKLNLTDKNDRIMLFRTIRSGGKVYTEDLIETLNNLNTIMEKI